MCINSPKGRFTVDRGGKCFIFTTNTALIFTFNLNDMWACEPFRKFRKASKYYGEVDKAKISAA